MSQSIDWLYWLKLPEVKVFEALALLHNTEPGSEPPDREDASPEYRKSLRLLLACLSDRSIFTPGTLNMGDPALHGVRLLEVGAWAIANGYKLPEKFPRPVRISKAPSPITPVRGAGSVPSRSPSPANWNKWKFIPKCELWKAICLTLDIEPNEEKHIMSSWLQSRHGVPYGFPEDFADRLQIAQANVSTNGPIHPQSLYVGVLNNPYGEVLLSEVAAASLSWGWKIPQAMQSLSIPIAAATPEPPEPVAVEKKEVTAKAAPTGSKLSINKAALIAQHKHIWPTIDSDIKNASENGLSKAAKAGARDWYEDDAMQWARSKNKLIQPTSAATLNSVMSNLPTRKHHLEG